jgi:hypothetical protein
LQEDNVVAHQIRLYATLKNTPELLSLYRKGDLEELTRFTSRMLAVAQGDQPRGASHPEAPDFGSGIRAVSTPSLEWRAAFVPLRAEATRAAVVVPREIMPDALIIAYDVQGNDVARSFLDIVNGHRHQPLDPQGNAFIGAGVDPGGSIADHWCPGAANLAIFGDRRHARRTIRADVLPASGFLGQGVNVVIIDEGLDKARIPPHNWGGGLDHYIDTDLVLPAGSAPPTSHGMMIARSVLNLAPNARLYDVPVIPATPDPNVPVFVSTVQAAYTSLLHEIRHRRSMPGWNGPWVLVNAWGVFDTRSDPFGSYTRNTEPDGHPMINLVTDAVQQDHLDIVFAAGNCGQFCPSGYCGGLDCGPGHSIWGANAHPLVITTGAVRSDETWVGYSSQGPGPELLAVRKPDLCAPSQFCETFDAALLSSGTSASCAMTAGVVAALRGNPDWNQVAVPPAALKAALIAGARKPYGPAGWDDRFGSGIVDVASTIVELSA